jgi:hypothetical protein
LLIEGLHAEIMCCGVVLYVAFITPGGSTTPIYTHTHNQPTPLCIPKHTLQSPTYLHPFNPSLRFNPRAALLPLLHQLAARLAILRIAQRAHHVALGLFAHEPPQAVDEEARDNVDAPLVRQLREHGADVEPAAEALEEFARALDARGHVRDGEELGEEVCEEFGLLRARGERRERDWRGAGARRLEDGTVAVQAVGDGGIEVAEAVGEEAQRFLVSGLAAVENNHFRNEFL